MENREKEIIKVSWIAVIGNLILAILKISIGIISGSLAVVGDGIDTATDILTSCITLFTAKILTKPPDIKYPYGYRKAETIATKLLSFIIFFAGAQLAISTIVQLVKGASKPIPEYSAIYITVISIFVKFFLGYVLLKTGKKLKSSMLIANGKNMQNDILISVTVLLGLFFTFVLHLQILDTITALIVSFFIMRVGYKLFIETYTELMDGIDDASLYNEIFEAIKKVEGAKNPHRARLRKLGNLYNLVIDIEVDGNIPVKKAHEIALNVENSIKKSMENIYDIHVHIEPIGNIENDEKFGISGKDIE